MADLTDRLLGLIPDDSQETVCKAIQFALKKHKGQFRNDGEPQTDHLLRVGIIAARYASENCPSDLRELVLSGLLHDVVEDTETTEKEITDFFGVNVARNVQAVSHFEEEEPDEVYLARVAAGGKNAVLAKRFDRLDNTRTLANTSPEFRAKKLAEIRGALHIWQRIDPDGAREIEMELEKF